MYEAGGYDGIWFAYKKEADERSGASGCVRLGFLTFSKQDVACSHRAAYSFNIVRAASATCAFSPKKKTHPDGDGPRWVRVGGWVDGGGVAAAAGLGITACCRPQCRATRL